MTIPKFVSKENLSRLIVKLKAFFVSDVTVSGTTITVTKNGNPVSKTIPNATTKDNGLMTAGDKSKLNGVAAGAQVNVIEGCSLSVIQQLMP